MSISSSSHTSGDFKTKLLFGIVMSKVYIMQENFNETAKRQKEHLIRF
jgi:hypothetical protein